MVWGALPFVPHDRVLWLSGPFSSTYGFFFKRGDGVQNSRSRSRSVGVASGTDALEWRGTCVGACDTRD